MEPAAGPDEYARVAEFYDHVGSYRERSDVAFYMERARRSGGPVLELGCGTGRILIPTARAGVEIVGLDSSPAMLSVCRDKLSREPLDVRSRVRIAHGDIRCFDLERRFALVTLPFRPFQHLITVEDQLQCLAAVHRHLAPGGELVLDVFNPFLQLLLDESSLVECGDEPEFTLDDGRRVLRRQRTVARDLFKQVLDQELIYYVTDLDGRVERVVHRFRMRYLFRFEAEHLLARAGFRVGAVNGDFDGTPYGETAYPGELIFVAKRETRAGDGSDA